MQGRSRCRCYKAAWNLTSSGLEEFSLLLTLINLVQIDLNSLKSCATSASMSPEYNLAYAVRKAHLCLSFTITRGWWHSHAASGCICCNWRYDIMTLFKRCSSNPHDTTPWATCCLLCQSWRVNSTLLCKASCNVTTLATLLSSVPDPEESGHHCKGIETVAQLLAHAHLLAQAPDGIPFSFLRAQAPAVEHIIPPFRSCSSHFVA